MKKAKYKHSFLIVLLSFSGYLVTGCVRIYPYRICGNVAGEIDSINIDGARGKRIIVQNGSKYCATGHVVVGIGGGVNAVCKSGLKIPLNVSYQFTGDDTVMRGHLNGRLIKYSSLNGYFVDSLDLDCVNGKM